MHSRLQEKGSWSAAQPGFACETVWVVDSRNTPGCVEALNLIMLQVPCFLPELILFPQTGLLFLREINKYFPETVKKRRVAWW